MNDEVILKGDSLTLYNALCTVKEVIFPPSVLDSDIAEALADDNSMFNFADDCGMMCMKFLGYDTVALLKNKPSDPEFFTGIFRKSGSTQAVTDTTRVSNYLPKQGNLKIWQLLTYNLKNSILFFECEPSSMYDFYEVFPLAMAMANGNKVYLLEEGTQGKLNDSSTVLMYKHIAAALREPTMPAYLRLQYAVMVQGGMFGMVLGAEDTVVACEITHTSIGNVKSIPAEYLRKSIDATAGVSTFRLKYTVPMLELFVWQRPINIDEIQAILNPLALVTWVDDVLVNKACKRGLMLPDDIVPTANLFDGIPSDLAESLKLYRVINGYNVERNQPEQKLDMIRLEGLQMLCGVISKLWCNRERNIYMQDLAIVYANGQYHIVAPIVEAQSMSHDCIIHAIVCGEQVSRSANHSLPICPLVQDYYMAGFSCSEAIKNHGEFIKQALYYKFTKYFPYDNALVTSFDVHNITGAEFRVPFIQELLSYNNVKLEQFYNDIPEHSNELTVPVSTLDPYGKINKRLDVGGQRVIKISL